MASGSVEERLSAELSSSDFTVASYLNLALSEAVDIADGHSHSDDSSAQSRMAQVALQLQLQTQSCHEEIGKIGAELQAIVPRCAADVGRVGVGLQGLEADASDLLEQALQVLGGETAVDESLETLSRLHALQAHLTTARDVLHAASQWDATRASVPPLLALSNLAGAVDALFDLEQGTHALEGMPGHQEREQALQDTRKQVTALLQPKLSVALQQLSATGSNNTKPLEEMVQLYTKLQQSEQLIQSYVQTTAPRHAQVRQAWFDYTPNTSQSFAEWLPTFLNLTLLKAVEQEHAQATKIFGCTPLVPQLLRKCLRHLVEPLQSSFASRLTTLAAPVVAGTTTTAAGGAPVPTPNSSQWPAIAEAYQCVLQFCGTLYESSLASSWLDWAETQDDSSSAADEFAAILETLQSTLRQPFERHIANFINLERAHLEQTVTAVLDDPSLGLYGTNGSGLDNLNLEQLKASVRAIFSDTLPKSWQRMELLNHTAAAEFETMMDDVLITFGSRWTGHIRENLVARTDALDEAHVHTALSVLETVGLWDADLHVWQSHVQERMDAPKRWTPSSVRLQTTMPESLALNDMTSLLAIRPNVAGETATAGEETLVTTTPFSRAAGMVHQKLGPAAVNLVFDVCSAVPRAHLQDLAGLPNWSAANGNSDADAYGILPQPYMNHVGEHMVALVQALEPFSDPQSLQACQRVLDVAHVSRQPWRELVQACGSITLSDAMLENLRKGGRDLEALTVEEAVYEEYEVDEAEATPARMFGNLWLDVVASAVTGRLLERLLRIPSLSHRGGQQLQADLAYLANVLSALGVDGHPHVLVTHFEVLVGAEASVLQETIAGRNPSQSLEAFLKALEEQLAAIRSSY